MEDLNIKVEPPFAVYPAEPRPLRYMYLSNMDQTLVAPVGTVSFFSACEMSFEEVVRSYTEALSKILVSYDFMAGRLKVNEAQDRLEIECNGAGAFFATASSELTLEELGDIYTPNVAFKQLVLHDHVALSPSSFHLPLFTLQATRFKCGAFAVAAGLNHCILDGISCFDIMINMASIARGKGLTVVPYLDRTILKAREPPKIEYDHVEWSKLSEVTLPTSNFSGRGLSAPPAPLSSIPDVPSEEENVLKLFSISGEMLERLKEKGMGGNESDDGGKRRRKCTSFEVVTALVWKARALALEMESNDMTTVLFPVDIRAKLEPPLPREYAGNGVMPAYARATVKELEQEPFPVLVRMVQQGLRRINNDYARSVIDWLEVHRGIPCVVRSFSVVAWWRLGMDDVEFPWGKPIHFGPVIFSNSAELVLILPHHEKKEHGLNIAIALPPHHMSKFEQLLQQEL